MQINITAIVKSLPEKTEEMKALLQELMHSSVKEAACLQYDLYQVAASPDEFILHEIWKDAESLELHVKTPHFFKFAHASAQLLAEPLTVYKTNRI